MRNSKLISVGNAIVDIISKADDDFLISMGYKKGSMNLVSEKNQNRILNSLKHPKIISGGSAANTAVGFSSFGGNSVFIGQVGNDEYGKKFERNLNEENVQFNNSVISTPKSTSKSIILVTDDAERTMLTYLGASTLLKNYKIDFSKDDIIYIEGYLFDEQESKDTITKICADAKINKLKVAFTVSDIFCIERNRKDFLNLINDYVDIIFSNKEEICTLYKTNVDDAITELAKSRKSGSVTLGNKGSIAFDQSNRILKEPPMNLDVKDTTGAGDMYAAGFLYGLSKGFNLNKCANLGTKAASHIISHFGARPKIKFKNLI